jgi:signal transduction histidine kinase
MSDRIDYQLRLARLKMRTGSHTGNASLNAALNSTIAVLKKTHRGEALQWAVDLAEDLTVNIERNDLLELLGILLENASEWAASRVHVATARDGECAMITIDDDGAGLSSEQMESLGVRGKRLDESRSGNGMGLAIALEIAGLNKGSLEFKRSTLGGFCALLKLPQTLG